MAFTFPYEFITYLRHMITAKKIRSKRKANDILQSELANHIGATTSYICNVESGGSVSYKQLTLIMNAVDEIILDKKQST